MHTWVCVCSCVHCEHMCVSLYVSGGTYSFLTILSRKPVSRPSLGPAWPRPPMYLLQGAHLLHMLRV